MGSGRTSWVGRRVVRAHSLTLRFYLAAAVLMLIPVLVWRANPARSGYPQELAAVAGTMLAALTFVLEAAKSTFERTTDAVVAELTERDRRLCDAASKDDPEPWPPQAVRELALVRRVVAISKMTPAEHSRRAELAGQRQRAQMQLWSLSMRAARQILDRENQGTVRERDDRDVDFWIAAGLKGDDGRMPEDLRHACDWPTIARQAAPIRARDSAAAREADSIEDAAFARGDDIFEFPVGYTKPTSELPRRFEDALRSYLEPLELAYVVVLALASLAATGMAYLPSPWRWPWPPAVLASFVVLVVAGLYVAVVRDQMDTVGKSVAPRLMRLGTVSLTRASTCLGDALVEQTLGPRGALRETFEASMDATVATFIPLRERLLGQVCLYEAMPLAESAASLRRAHQIDPAVSSLGVKDVYEAHTLIERAVRHLERALAPGRDDDPVALLALAKAIELEHELSGDDGTDPRPAALAHRAVAPVLGITLGDAAGRAQIGAHTWLHPHAEKDLLHEVIASSAIAVMRPR